MFLLWETLVHQTFPRSFHQMSRAKNHIVKCSTSLLRTCRKHILYVVCVCVCFEVDAGVPDRALCVCVCVSSCLLVRQRTRRGVSEVIWPRWSHTARCHSLRISCTLRDLARPGGTVPASHTHTQTHKQPHSASQTHQTQDPPPRFISQPLATPLDLPGHTRTKETRLNSDTSSVSAHTLGHTRTSRNTHINTNAQAPDKACLSRLCSCHLVL